MTSETYCHVHKTKCAEFWCQNCPILLCLDCKTDHNKAKQFCQHNVLKVSECQDFLSFIGSVKNKCEDHSQCYEFYCHDHKEPFCFLCTEHTMCKETGSLKKIISNIKSSTSFKNVHSDAIEISKYLEKVRENRNCNRKHLGIQKNVLLNEIRNFRQKILKHVDKLEQSLLEELSQNFLDADCDMEKIINMVDDNKKRLNEVESNFVNLKRYANDIQAFLGCRFLESEIEKQRIFIESLHSNPMMRNMDIHVTFDEYVMNFSEKWKTMGKISVTKSPNQTVFVRTVDDIALKRKTYIKINSEKSMVITGCAILPDGQTAFIDFQNSLLIIHRKSGSFNEKIKLSGKPSSIAKINDKQLAVALWSESKIAIVDIGGFREMKQIPVEGKCYGINFLNDVFLVSVDNCNKVQIIDVLGGKINEILLPTEQFSYVTQHGRNLLCSFERQNCVKRVTFYGEELWSFSHDALLKPHQIAVDFDGFLYVACYESNKVMAISSDGRQSRVMLDKTDGLEKPSSISFCKESNLMLVCNAYSGDAHLYFLT